MSVVLTAPRILVDALTTLASGLDHPEGICLDPGGTLYVSGEAGQIYRLGPDGTASVVATTGGWTVFVLPRDVRRAD